MKKWPFSFRSALAFMHDIAVAMFAWFSAFLLRFNFNIPSEQMALMKNTLIMVFVVEAMTSFSFGLYRGTWRFASLTDLKRILAVAFVSSVILVSILFIMNTETNIPRSILILNPILLILMMSGSRIIYRAFKEHQMYSVNLKQGKPVFIIGAGTTAISLIKDLSQSPEWQVIGMLDNDKSMHGREILGLKVFGPIEMLSKMQERFKFRHAIIAYPLASQEEKRSILHLANQLKLEILTVPAIEDLMSGRLNVSQIRRVDVEDLLGRESVELDNSELENLITNNVVMITGAGGSIGSELSRQVLKFKPRLLICFDLSEYALYQLEQSFISDQIQANILYIVGDVKNELRLRHLITQYQPSLVFHAAAYKHVPMMENDNVAEAIFNNVLGTYQVAKSCLDLGVEKFILVSTDKAVNPTNVMGATKRLAEMICQGLQEKDTTRFVIVRFGNVLASSGSVIPKFRTQIAAGGPVTVTHPDITRYFMSIPEAAQLVMQAGLMGKGGEIFVLDMGEPVKIVDLARDMIKLSGFQENEIDIKFTGLRPGEKLFEELIADGEHSMPTKHKKVRVAKARKFDTSLLNDLLAWVKSSDHFDEDMLKKNLSHWVKEYSPDLNAKQKNNMQRY
jgi:FlaA1/EpsC-like NDP-sugar epimerase